MNIEMNNTDLDVKNILFNNEMVKMRETLFNINFDFSSIKMLKGDKKILELSFNDTKKELLANGY
jgi:hypothetical protein